jgi:hypothetical protein
MMLWTYQCRIIVFCSWTARIILIVEREMRIGILCIKCATSVYYLLIPARSNFIIFIDPGLWGKLYMWLFHIKVQMSAIMMEHCALSEPLKRFMWRDTKEIPYEGSKEWLGANLFYGQSGFECLESIIPYDYYSKIAISLLKETCDVPFHAVLNKQ